MTARLQNNNNSHPLTRIFFWIPLLLAIVRHSPKPEYAVVDATVSPSKSLVRPIADTRKQTHRRRRLSPLNFHVINLHCDTERWESVTKELVSKGVSRRRIHRVEAVYGKNLTPEDLASNTTFVAKHFSTKGTIGCYLSHRKCWELVATSDNPYQIILEDDVLVTENFPQQVATILREIDEDCPDTRDGNWDVIFLGSLGCCHPSGKHGLNWIAGIMSGGLRKPRGELEGAPHCHVPRRPLGAHAYVLSKRGAQKLLENCWKVSGHVDVVAWGLPSLGVVSVHPMLCHQNMGSVSTIGAVTEGFETKLPRMVVDEYTGIVLEWVYNAPVLQLGPVLLTMGRSVTYILGGYILAALLYDKHPWILVAHTIVFGILFVLTKATTVCYGKEDTIFGNLVRGSKTFLRPFLGNTSS